MELCLITIKIITYNFLVAASQIGKGLVIACIGGLTRSYSYLFNVMIVSFQLLLRQLNPKINNCTKYYPHIQ